jgi:glycosyltransferase involved in cell wall biosynthesis
MDVVVHCSVEPEPFGRVVIEAMAASRPVVAYDWGGPHEIMVSGETGLLVPPGDIGHLSAAVLSLLRDPEKRQAMGAAGRARAAGHYDARAMARQVQDLLVEVGRGAGHVP